MFNVVGHGLDEGAMKEAMEASKEFFSLPLAEKSRIPIHSGGFTRGYVGVGGESGSTALELKEAFSYGYEWPAGHHGLFDNKLQGYNEWPSDQALGQEWRAKCTNFYNHITSTSSQLTRAFSLAVADNETHFADYCKGGDEVSLMRMFHYLPQHIAEHELTKVCDNRDTVDGVLSSPEECKGSSAHTDWGYLTLILQDSTGGLQLWWGDEWRDVLPKPGSLVVNAGDYLSLMTGGEVVSPLHRVVLHPSQHRHSMVFFYYPDYDARMPPLSSSQPLSFLKNQRVGDESKTFDPNQPFGEYIMEKWDQVFR